ncbi:MAG: hypothetical protein JRI39_10240 [Deltaproteobacteria bacterium]|nr:hypothetical protein [Deltaproteobacteria bacterium]
MKQIFSLFLCFLSFCLYQEKISKCYAAESWQEDEIALLRQIRKGLSDDTPVDLCVGAITSYDNRTIFIGGSYREAAGSYRSVLLISRDGGKSWFDSGVWGAGSHVFYIHFLDARHAWFLTAWSIEGDQAPYFIFRTSDGGHNWERCKGPLPGYIRTSLCWPKEFAFEDQNKGNIVFRSFDGEECKLVSSDGGITWDLVRSETRCSPLICHDACRQLLCGISRKYSILTDLDSGIITIKMSRAAGRAARNIGRLPLFYRFNGINVLPQCYGH